MDRSVTIAATPTRIATLIPFAADMLLEMGVTPVLVPAIRGDSPANWKDLPTVAVEHSSGPNLEQIVAANPDLIILTSVYAQFLPQIEASTKAPVVVLDVDSLEDVKRHITTLGRLTGRGDAANSMVAAIDEAAAAHQPPEGSPSADPTSVLAIFGTPHAFYTFLPESYLGDLVERANARLVTEGLVSHKIFRGLAPLSMESVIEKSPDVILVVFHGPKEMATAMLARDPAWGKLDAVTKGRAHILTDDLFVMHPGSRAPDAMKMIADALEPTAQ
jgi:iron complex transport system substrate-binding protein